MAFWDTLQNTVKAEIDLKMEQGYDVEEFQKAFAKAGEDEGALRAVYENLAKAERQRNYPYLEPNEFEEIIRDHRFPEDTVLTNQETLYEKLYGGWLGRCIGCSLGKPLERDPFVCGDAQYPGWLHIKKYFEGANAYPIDFFMPEKSTYSQECERAIAHPLGIRSTRERIQFSEADDDTRYTLLGMLLMEQSGYDFTTLQVAKLWADTVPARQICTAEGQAYINYCLAFPSVTEPTEQEFAKKSKEIRCLDNPYREWVGARIRVDGYSMCAPNMPMAAVRMAYADASFTHEKNGVYSAMYAAALVSLAFTAKDVVSLIETAKSVVPKKSRLYEAITFGAEVAAEKYDDFCEVAAKIWERYGKYNSFHAICNDCLLTAALIHSKGDFERGITGVVLGGFDTDSNGATIGCILGIMNGANKIPAKWKNAIHDTLETKMAGITRIPISECAQRCLNAIRKYNAAAFGNEKSAQTI